jgi:hypothetical protein
MPYGARLPGNRRFPVGMAVPKLME